MIKKPRVSVVVGAFLLAAASAPQVYAALFQMHHVLLISIDGMHALDFANCAKGISGVNGGAPYCPNLAQLGQIGVTYVEASTTKPSDSFPGLIAQITGGTPRSAGVFYDVSYDRALSPPAQTWPKTVRVPVQTTQIAPTILKALGLDPGKLQAVQMEHTQVLPGLNF